MNDFNVSLVFKLWDIANSMVVLSLAYTLAFLYKCSDKDFADNLRKKGSTFVITCIVIFAGFILYTGVIIGVQFGYEILLGHGEPTPRVWTWATILRLIVVIGSGVFCLGVIFFIGKKSTQKNVC